MSTQLVEITSELFFAIVDPETVCYEVKDTEFTSEHHYIVDDVRIISIEHFASATVSCHIQDINA